MKRNRELKIKKIKADYMSAMRTIRLSDNYIDEPMCLKKHAGKIEYLKVRVYQKSTDREIGIRYLGDYAGVTESGLEFGGWCLDWWAWPRQAMFDMIERGDLWIQYPQGYFERDNAKKDGHISSYVSLSLRYDIMRRDSFACVLCGNTQSDGVRLEVDHIYPRSKGGSNEESNLRTLCFDCNRGKRDKIEEMIVG